MYAREQLKYMARYALDCHYDDPKSFEMLVVHLAQVTHLPLDTIVNKIKGLSDGYVAKPLNERINGVVC